MIQKRFDRDWHSNSRQRSNTLILFKRTLTTPSDQNQVNSPSNSVRENSKVETFPAKKSPEAKSLANSLSFLGSPERSKGRVSSSIHPSFVSKESKNDWGQSSFRKSFKISQNSAVSRLESLLQSNRNDGSSLPLLFSDKPEDLHSKSPMVSPNALKSFRLVFERKKSQQNNLLELESFTTQTEKENDSNFLMVIGEKMRQKTENWCLTSVSPDPRSQATLVKAPRYSFKPLSSFMRPRERPVETSPVLQLESKIKTVLSKLQRLPGYFSPTRSTLGKPVAKKPIRPPLYPRKPFLQV